MTNTILKYIPQEELIEAPKEEVVVKDPSLTKARVETAYSYLKWVGAKYVPPEASEFGGKGYKEIAKASGLTVEQVKHLHAELKEAKAEVNKVEEEVTT